MLDFTADRVTRRFVCRAEALGHPSRLQMTPTNSSPPCSIEESLARLLLDYIDCIQAGNAPHRAHLPAPASTPHAECRPPTPPPTHSLTPTHIHTPTHPHRLTHPPTHSIPHPLAQSFTLSLPAGHDQDFAPDLDVILEQTLPALDSDRPQPPTPPT